MRIIAGLVASTRCLISIMSSLMTTACFIQAGMTLQDAIGPAFTVLCICIATMVLNDRVDWRKDAEEGKTFVRDHKRLFTFWTIAWWLLAIQQSLHLQQINTRYAVLSLAMCALGIAYSWLRNLPGIPLITVALTSALAGCYRIVVGDFRGWTFPVIVLCIILGRETGKDSLNVEADMIPGIGKRTLPILWGTNSAMTFVRGCLVVAGILLLCLSNSSSTIMVILGISISAYMLGPATIQLSKMVLDLSMLVFLIKSNFFSSSPVKYCMGLLGGKFGEKMSGAFYGLLSGKTGEKFVKVEGKPSGKAVWVLAYSSLAIVLTALGCLRSPMEGVFTALSGVALLIILNYTPIDKAHEANGQVAYIRVRRMIVGMVIGLFAASLARVGIPLIVTALVIPTLVITKMVRSQHCTVLKDHAAILGIVLVCSLILGVQYTITNIAIAYLPVLIIYYWKALREGIPIWKPAFLY